MLFYLYFDCICLKQTKKENVKVPIERDFLKIAKINPQQEKPVFPDRKNLFPQDIKNRPSANHKLLPTLSAAWYSVTLSIHIPPSVEKLISAKQLLFLF